MRGPGRRSSCAGPAGRAAPGPLAAALGPAAPPSSAPGPPARAPRLGEAGLGLLRRPPWRGGAGAGARLAAAGIRGGTRAVPGGAGAEPAPAPAGTPREPPRTGVPFRGRCHRSPAARGRAGWAGLTRRLNAPEPRRRLRPLRQPGAAPAAVF